MFLGPWHELKKKT